jgi:uncharacterized protein (DUF1501 family)
MPSVRHGRCSRRARSNRKFERASPRVGALAYNGWDTHINEGAMGGKLANLLGALDAAIAGLETGMGPAWRETVVVVVTEFGRTTKLNGTFGTDHGTGTVVLLAAGAQKGGRVFADWPGEDRFGSSRGQKRAPAGLSEVSSYLET